MPRQQPMFYAEPLLKGGPCSVVSVPAGPAALTSFCEPMRVALGLGVFSSVENMSFARMRLRRGVMATKGRESMLLNHCPWCGSSLLAWLPFSLTAAHESEP